jgi:hypothetical protein
MKNGGGIISFFNQQDEFDIYISPAGYVNQKKRFFYFPQNGGEMIYLFDFFQV